MRERGVEPMITNVDKSNEVDTARDLKNEKVRRVVTLILQSAVLILQICVFTETVFLLFSGKAYYIGSGWTDESNILHATVYVLILYAVCEAAARTLPFPFLPKTIGTARSARGLIIGRIVLSYIEYLRQRR